MQQELSSTQLLTSKGIRPSYARLQIYNYLREKRNHPTVDDIYEELVVSIPTLSRTTVYNTLALFLKSDLLQLVTIEENELRFDADTSYHGHFKCLQCKKVYDFSADFDNIKEINLEGFDIMQKSLYYTGICKKCKEG